MQTYDFLMLLVLAGATLFGFVKGLAWQVASIASLIVSYILAVRFSEQMAPMFGSTAPLNRFIAMLAIYVGSSFAIWMIFRMVSGAIDRVKLKEFDRQMGAMVGLGKGVLWCVAITFFAVTLLESQRDQILQSRSGHYIARLLNETESMVPAEVHKVIGPYLDRARTEIDPSRAGTPATPWSTSQPSTPSGWGQPTTPTTPQTPTWPSSTPTNTTPAWPSSTPGAPSWPSSSGWPQGAQAPTGTTNR